MTPEEGLVAKNMRAPRRLLDTERQIGVWFRNLPTFSVKAI